MVNYRRGSAFIIIIPGSAILKPLLFPAPWRNRPLVTPLFRYLRYSGIICFIKNYRTREYKLYNFRNNIYRNNLSTEWKKKSPFVVYYLLALRRPIWFILIKCSLQFNLGELTNKFINLRTLREVFRSLVTLNVTHVVHDYSIYTSF